jgi:RpiB/LacA/LacB family sugar-phosphate isomerase
MKVGIAADHGGYLLKEEIKGQLKNAGYEVKDFGAHEFDAQDDYPDFVAPLAEAVAQGDLKKGIALCGSGVGASIVANKIPGVRAALISEHYSAHQGVEHDAMNIICVGGRVFSSVYVWEMIQAFLEAKYTGEERHERRLKKLQQLEKKYTQ